MQLIREFRLDPERRQLMRRALWITFLGNLGLAAGKAVAARLSGSVALYADAANSISDVLYSLAIVLGLWLAQRPPDLSHPQGHGRYEPLAGLVVAAAMTLAAYEAGQTAIQRLVEGGAELSLGWPTVALLLSAIVKAGMFALIHRIAALTRSSTLDATAKDNLADVLTSLAAFLGILGSQLIHPMADAVAGILVALWILRSALGVWQANLRYLTGGGASAELRTAIVDAARGVPGVGSVHQILTEHVGPELVADLHINVDGNMPLFHSHGISDEVRVRVESLPGIDRAYVHAEPFEATPRR
ncbi:MAG: cation diffusion facilitator family transporter [Anaerolineae bacterium]|nr:cation diffusion facilitator family transporter [Anaerolineae bacterium]